MDTIIELDSYNGVGPSSNADREDTETALAVF